VSSLAFNGPLHDCHGSDAVVKRTLTIWGDKPPAIDRMAEKCIAESF
jgi:hypothetical protein